MFTLTTEMVLAAGGQDMSKLNPTTEYRYPVFGFEIFPAQEIRGSEVVEGYSARFFLSLRNECYIEIWMMPVFVDVYFGVIGSEEEFKNIISQLIK